MVKRYDNKSAYTDSILIIWRHNH